MANAYLQFARILTDIKKGTQGHVSITGYMKDHQDHKLDKQVLIDMALAAGLEVSPYGFNVAKPL